MKNLALKRIQKMAAYTPPLENRRAYRGLLLDFNERAIPPSPQVATAIKKYLRNPRWQIYPEYSDLTERIARYAKTPSDQVMITNGSEQGMDLVFRTFVEKSNEVIIPSPSYSMLYQFAGLVGARVITPQYLKTNSFPTSAVLKAITKKTKLIIICNPNNPTGSLASLKDVATIARRAPNAIIYVDEAYYEFSGLTAVPLIKRFPNIIVTRTFSKAFGLVSLRIGYLIARPEYIKECLKVRGPYDINMVSCYGARAALSDVSNTKKYVREVMNKAKPLVEKFFRQNKTFYLPSNSNFILFRPNNATQTWKILNQNGFRTRIQNRPGVESMLRVTVGMVEQMQKFIRCYQKKVLPQKFAFLDRDGTLIFEPPDTKQIDSLAKLKILPGVIAGLQKLVAQGYRLIMITNQDGLGTTSFPEPNFARPQNKMLKIFKSAGIVFDEICICPHFVADNCACRKPKLGLLQPWLKKNRGKIDWENSFALGDRPSDRQLAKNLGVRFISVRTNSSFATVIKKLNL